MGLARLVGAATVGYLAGTIPSADIAARLASGGTTDLRSEGSGNPGAANAIRILGPKWGYTVMVADIGKGVAACVAGRSITGDVGAHIGGTAAVVGHCFPVWTGFRGGKGVATSVGQCLATFPAYTPVDLTIAAATTASARWKRQAGAATWAASVCWVGGAIVWWRRRWPNWWGPKPTVALPIAACASSAVVLYRFSASRAPAKKAALP